MATQNTKTKTTLADKDSIDDPWCTGDFSVGMVLRLSEV